MVFAWMTTYHFGSCSLQVVGRRDAEVVLVLSPEKL